MMLAASVSLWGCSLAAPKEGELFAPGTAQNEDAGGLDAAAGDSGRDGGGQSEGGGPLAEAAVPNDAGDAADGGQDAGPTVFDPRAGLKVHYSFDETSGDTVNNFAGSKGAIIKGTPSGFTQWVSPGHSDGALKLGGGPTDGGVGHHVELPQGVLSELTACTISVWMNRAGGKPQQRVFDFGNDLPTWIYFTAHGGNGLPAVAGRRPDPAGIFVDYMAITGAPMGEGLLRITQPIPVSTWAHFVLTWNASEMKVYLNGKLAAQAPVFGQVAPADLGYTGQNYLGRSQFSGSPFFDPYFEGMLDEFRIYDRVLSDSDVAQLYELK